MATSEADVNRRQDDDSHATGQQWKWTVLAGMASYLDAGSIVALAAGLGSKGDRPKVGKINICPS